MTQQWRVFLDLCYNSPVLILVLIGLSVSSVGIATRYGLDVRESNPGGGDIFRIRPDRPWGPPSIVYNGYRAFPGGKATGAWR